eukprot:4632290-Pyramimonas_sp.AAC.1
MGDICPCRAIVARTCPTVRVDGGGSRDAEEKARKEAKEPRSTSQYAFGSYQQGASSGGAGRCTTKETRWSETTA